MNVASVGDICGWPDKEIIRSSDANVRCFDSTLFALLSTFGVIY